jgi:hypothetical protein
LRFTVAAVTMSIASMGQTTAKAWSRPHVKANFHGKEVETGGHGSVHHLRVRALLQLGVE